MKFFDINNNFNQINFININFANDIGKIDKEK